jgi:hypothetical protein
MFMASVSFRCEDREKWEKGKHEIENMFLGLDGLVSNLDSEGTAFGILSPYGDMGMFLAELPKKISRITGDYAVMAMCADSDYNMMELYRDGELLEKSCIGECYEDYDGDLGYESPDVEKWAPLLLDQTRLDELKRALFEVDVFAEDNLRLLTELTGLPVLDDEMMMSAL